MIGTGAMTDPYIPLINDTEENLRGLLDYCIEAKVHGILNFGIGVTLREGDREYFYETIIATMTLSLQNNELSVNDIDFSGIDIVRFGDSINQILYRETISKTSLLAQYERAMEIFEMYYQYEQIEGFKRVKVELIPIVIC